MLKIKMDKRTLVYFYTKDEKEKQIRITSVRK